MGYRLAEIRPRRKLQEKRILWLLAAGAVAAAAVHLVHEFQVKRNAGAFLRQADLAEQQGNRQHAAGYLSGYLGYKPEDAATLRRYAILLDELATAPKSRRRAALALEHALRREPRNEDLRRRAATAEIELSQCAQAAGHLEILLQAHPNDAELEQQLGRCHAVSGDFPRAVALLEKAIGHAPARIDVYTQLAAILRDRLGQPQRAAAVMQAMILANAQTAAAYIARARFDITDEAYAKAAQDLEVARKLAPGNREALLLEAEFAQHTGWRHGLGDELRSTLLQHPEDDRLCTALARFELSLGRRIEGIEALRRGLKVSPFQPDLLAMLAETNLQDGRLDEAGDLIKRLEKSGGAPALALYLRSLVLKQSRKFEDAARLLESARPGLAAWPAAACRADLELSECYERLGDKQEALAAQRRAVRADSRSAPARFALGSTMLALGMLDEAAEEFHQCLAQRDPPAAAWAGLVETLIQRNALHPPSQHDWGEVSKALARAEAAAPASPAVLILRAELLAAQERLSEAQALLEKACAASPAILPMRIALVDVLQRSGKTASALQTLKDAQRQLGDCVELRIALARYFARQDLARAEKELAELAKDVEKFTPEERVELWRELAGAAYLFGAASSTEHYCRELLEQQPRDKPCRLLLFDLALQSGRAAAIEQALGELRRIEGDEGLLWKCGDAARLVLLARRGQKQARLEARVRLAEVAARAPGWSYVPLLEGILDELDGNDEGAIDHYLQAIDKGDQRPQLMYRVAQLLHAHRRDAEAQHVMRKWEARYPLDGRYARLAAEIALGVNDLHRALELARKAVPVNARDYRDCLWLAKIEEAAGQLVDARATL
ncbi:MAG TPA: tetratricopeptide repeat protein, partial [Gemmataceae bacterium]|nr:tetratricopeptide repeat protein [Gemmataceae bacterium]